MEPLDNRLPRPADFGDHLTAAQRRAIIEYLKTL
jgi:hypothetical protein